MGDSAEKQSRPNFFQGVKAELKKVVWPDRKSTHTHTHTHTH